MLLLFFQADEQSYALEISSVEEVVPFVGLRPLADAPCGVAGLLNYRGSVMPVLDLSALLGGEPARNRLSTRMAILRLETDGACYRLALLVEGATETRAIQPADLRPSGVLNENLPCLGDVFVEGGRVVQLIDPVRLLTETLKTVMAPAGRNAG